MCLTSNYLCSVGFNGILHFTCAQLYMEIEYTVFYLCCMASANRELNSMSFALNKWRGGILEG